MAHRLVPRALEGAEVQVKPTRLEIPSIESEYEKIIFSTDGIIEGSKEFELDENIAIRACDWCGQPFYQGRHNHRFCCLECGRKFHMAERRAALALFRAINVTSYEEDERRRMVG
jgi:hypothetical protein